MHPHQVSVVTGASSGIGRAVVQRLARRGGTLVLADLAPADRHDVVGADEVVCVRCDVSARDDVASLAATAASAGPVRSVVHAAGISPTMGSAAAILRVDLLGSALIVEAFERIVAPGGSAVLVASMASRFAPASDAAMDALLDDPLADGALDALVASPLVRDEAAQAYPWAKRGVVRLTARSAMPWGRKGARINCVSPGTIDTPMGQRELAVQPMMTSMLEQTPAGRIGQPDDIAKVIEFLLSDDAAYVTGADVLVDGGIVAALGV